MDPVPRSTERESNEYSSKPRGASRGGTRAFSLEADGVKSSQSYIQEVISTSETRKGYGEILASQA